MYPSDHLPNPLKPSDFYTLLALSRGSSHRYALKAIIHNDSLGSVSVPPNKLYPLLAKLHEEGFIELAGKKPSGKSGRLQMHYAISEYGSVRLQEELQRLSHALKIGQATGLMDNTVSTDIQRLLVDVGNHHS